MIGNPPNTEIKCNYFVSSKSLFISPFSTNWLIPQKYQSSTTFKYEFLVVGIVHVLLSLFRSETLILITKLFKCISILGWMEIAQSFISFIYIRGIYYGHSFPPSSHCITFPRTLQQTFYNHFWSKPDFTNYRKCFKIIMNYILRGFLLYGNYRKLKV